MIDILFVLFVVGFFALCAAMINGLEKLME
jgi:hypothetical protein